MRDYITLNGEPWNLDVQRAISLGVLTKTHRLPMVEDVPNGSLFKIRNSLFPDEVYLMVDNKLIGGNQCIRILDGKVSPTFQPLDQHVYYWKPSFGWVYQIEIG